MTRNHTTARSCTDLYMQIPFWRFTQAITHIINRGGCRRAMQLTSNQIGLRVSSNMEQAWKGSLETWRDSDVEKWAARFFVMRQFWFIMDERPSGQKGSKMEKDLYIKGDDPSFERLTDRYQCPHLNKCGQTKIMRAVDALDHLLSIPLILSLSCFLIFLLSFLCRCFSLCLQFPIVWEFAVQAFSSWPFSSYRLYSPSVHIGPFNVDRP